MARFVGVGLLALMLAASAGAEIYRWTDGSGRVHFTQDLTQVPAPHRKQAEDAAKGAAKDSGGGSVQTFSRGRGAASSAPAARARTPRGGDVHRIRVARAGTSMMVNVRLNNSVSAPFLIDTGASDVLVPKDVADKLGLDTGPTARTKRYSTANGVVEHPVVMLRSVALGSATVKNVPASVSPNMSVGLLGLSFFNHFTYNVDAAAGIVTLQRNQLASTGKIRGGRSRAQWASEYANLNARIERTQYEFEGKAESKSRVRRQLESQLEELERQLATLDEEADRAHVPMSWRY